MPRFFLVLLFLKAFVCFSQQSDTIRIEKDPLVITHKVYVLDASETKNRQAITLMLMPQWLSSDNKSESLHLSKGKGLSFRLLYEKEFKPLRIGIGVGMGTILQPFTQITMQTYLSSTTVTVIDTLERYYKLNGSDTLWHYVTEERQEQKAVERTEKNSSSQNVHYFFAELPVNLSVFHSLGSWELGVGVEACARKNFGERLPFRSWNLTGGIFGSLGYRFSEKFCLNLSPRYGRDLTPTSDQFQNSYSQLALSSSFFW